MPTISMFYGILIKMFFKDIEKHHTHIFMLNFKEKSLFFLFQTGRFLRGK
jgi:hypothetical protein